MIKIIEPKHHRFYETSIELFLELVKRDEEKKNRAPLFTPEELARSTFIIVEDKHWGISGGAILCQRPIQTLQPSIKNIMSTFLPYQQQMWVGSLYFNREAHHGNNHILNPLFYYDFLESLVLFGIKKDVSALSLILSPQECFHTKSKGLWPYLFALTPQNSFDGLFHGVLPLTLKSYKAYKFMWNEGAPSLKEIVLREDPNAYGEIDHDDI